MAAAAADDDDTGSAIPRSISFRDERASKQATDRSPTTSTNLNPKPRSHQCCRNSTPPAAATNRDLPAAGLSGSIDRPR